VALQRNEVLPLGRGIDGVVLDDAADFKTFSCAVYCSTHLSGFRFKFSWDSLEMQMSITLV